MVLIFPADWNTFIYSFQKNEIVNLGIKFGALFDGNIKIGILLIILAACFWGSMGIFVRKLGEYGFSSIQIVSIRITIAALVFCIILLIKDRTGFRISPWDISLFLGLGLGSVSVNKRSKIR